MRKEGCFLKSPHLDETSTLEETSILNFNLVRRILLTGRGPGLRLSRIAQMGSNRSLAHYPPRPIASVH
jgi:hypothetical protein